MSNFWIISCLRLWSTFRQRESALSQSLAPYPAITLSFWALLIPTHWCDLLHPNQTGCIVYPWTLKGTEAESSFFFPRFTAVRPQRESFSLIQFLIISWHDRSCSPAGCRSDPFNHSSLVLFLKLTPPVTYWAGKLSMFSQGRSSGQSPI